jgi:transcription initiation factor TFIID TATA-box-binding protein
MGEPKVVMLMFSSGKLVCTGAKHEDMVREAVEKAHKILEDYDLIYYE